MEERIVAADPVADPQGYRRELLALLGDDDPGEVLETTLRAFQDRTRAFPRSWSAGGPSRGSGRSPSSSPTCGTRRSSTGSGRGPS
jgi:hypothetical protein